MINLFALSSTLFAAFCLAASGPSVPKIEVGEVDSLKNIITNQHPGVLASFLATVKHWDREVAIAYAIGQVLGNCCEEPNSMSNSSSSSSLGVKKDCVMLDFEPYSEHTTLVKIRVNMNSLQSLISANLEWKDESGQTYNPFKELVDLEKIQNPANYKNEAFLYPDDIRYQFAKHGKTANAMIAIDVAILRWLAHAIKTKPQHFSRLVLRRDSVLGICSLSMHPTIEGLCEDDILTVLTHLQSTFELAGYPDDDVDYFRPSLITLIKFLVEGPIRSTVLKILTYVCSYGFHDFVNSKMLLGAEHEFVKHLEKYHTSHQLTTCEGFYQKQTEYKRKFYSMIVTSRCKYYAGKMFVELPFETQLYGLISNDSSLHWIEEESNHRHMMATYYNQVDHEYLLIISSQLKMPAAVKAKFTSCISLSMFQDELLKDRNIIQMIFTYGLTIMENKSKHILQPIWKGNPFFYHLYYFLLYLSAKF